MDGVRYGFALLWLVSFPVLFFWLALHPFVAFWRRMGLVATYTILLAGCAAMGAVLFSFRGVFLAVAFETGPALWVLTALATLASSAVETQARKHLRTATLVGVPELRGERDEPLLTQGIYGTIRHPRYVGAMLGYTASAFFANYLFLWAALPVFLLLLHTVVLFEEQELLDRYGREYADYVAKVPRYLPRLG